MDLMERAREIAIELRGCADEEPDGHFVAMVAFSLLEKRRKEQMLLKEELMTAEDKGVGVYRNSDGGVGMAADAVAVAYTAKGGYEIVLPGDDPEADMPYAGMMLIALAMRLTDDEAFCREMADWFAQKCQPKH